jgi:hypothetical protein
MARKKKAKIPSWLTQGFVEKIKEQGESRYQIRNDSIRELRSLRYMEHDFEIPKNYRATTDKIKTYLVGKWIETEVGALTTLPFQVHVPHPPDASEEQIRNTSAVELWLTNMWRKLEMQMGRDLYRNFVDQMVSDGVGVLKAMYRPSAWAGMPELEEFVKDRTRQASDDEQKRFNDSVDNFIRKSPLPFAVRTVDPTTVFPVYGTYGIKAVVEVTQVDRRETEELTQVFDARPLNSDDKPGLNEMVEVIEYWNDTWFALIIDGEWIGAFEHKHRRIPYFIAGGQETPDTRPEFENISTAFKLKNTAPFIDKLLTMKFSRAHQTTFPSYQVQGYIGGADDPGGETIIIEFEPGGVHPIEEGSRGFEPIAVPGFTNDIEETISALVSFSAETQIGDGAAGGDRLSGESGFMRAQLTDLARTGYHQIISHAERELSAFFEWILEMIEQEVKETLWIIGGEGREGKQSRRWIKLSKSIINGYYFVEVRILPFNPVMDIAKGQYAANMVSAGMFDKEFALSEIVGISDPEAMSDRLLVEELMESPAIKSALMERAAMRLGLIQPQEQAQAAPALVGPNGQPLPPELTGLRGGEQPGAPSVPGVGQALI